MSIYTITYYLKEESHSCDCGDHNHDHHHHVRDDYEITAHIKELGSWAYFMPDSFLLKTDLSANEVLEKLTPYIENGDMIFVNQVNKDSVASSSSQVIDWINR